MPEPTLSTVLREYAKATTSYWWLIFAGILMPLPELWKHFHPHGKELPIPKWLRWSLGIGCLFLAQFLAYRNQATNLATAIEEKRQLAIKVNEYSQKLSQPDLQPKIMNVFSAPAGESNKDVVLGVMGTIKNSGAPGAVDDFWVDLKLSDSRVLHAEFPTVPGPRQNLILGKSTGGHTISVSGEAYWTRNARSKSIPTNTGLDGWIMAVFRGVTAEEARNGATVILICSDVTGKKSSTEYTLSGRNEFPKFFNLAEIQKRKRKH